MGRVRTAAVWGACFGLGISSASCAQLERRAIARASHGLGSAVQRGDRAAIAQRVAPGVRPAVDMHALAGGKKSTWSRRLRKPKEIRPDAVVMLTADHPARVIWTSQGWRFADDPTAIFAQDTPAHALRALVLASKHARWDVLLRLAPRRYRIGLAESDLRAAWTEGEHAAALRRARDRVAAHLGDPILADEHEARLDLGEGHVVRLEREGDAWVIVDF
jgi:hypothetical protein